MQSHYEKYGRNWYEKNKERNALRSRKWASAHRAETVKITQKHVAKNKEKVSEYNKTFSQTNAGRYRFYASAAKQKGREFSLTPEEFSEKMNQPCVYCGDTGKVGIDRIDNSIGYTLQNSAPCCITCNFMKKNHTLENFMSHIMKIARYNT